MRAHLRRYAVLLFGLFALAFGCAAMVAPELVLTSASDSGRGAQQLPGALKWEMPVIRVVIVRDRYWTAERQQRAIEGFREWRPFLKDGNLPRFVIQTSSVANGDVNVRFVPDGVLEGQSVGLTRWEHRRGKIKSAQVVLSCEDDPEDFARQRSTAAHELGHALGITYHSRHREDLMYFTSIGKGVSSADAARLADSYKPESD